uniref:Uncharacterized protein n=1 Tax=Eutreptiella gymnastica TaxID=73025 RepID=A0A7S1JH98_9EUGL|mmetsp:Transcript_980/g.2032  ORF Transcript_980/g.2032 Transcript_980/m.2032 type:complete len:133 (+) Transcript_980:8-406(+)
MHEEKGICQAPYQNSSHCGPRGAFSPYLMRESPLRLSLWLCIHPTELYPSPHSFLINWPATLLPSSEFFLAVTSPLSSEALSAFSFAPLCQPGSGAMGFTMKDGASQTIHQSQATFGCKAPLYQVPGPDPGV